MRLLIVLAVVVSVLGQCTNPAPGTTTVTVQVDGQGARTFTWFVPVGLAPNQPAATVFGWHGLGGNGINFANAGDWRGSLQQQLWFGVFPDGAAGCHNGGACCFCGQDDIAFTRAMLQFIDANSCVDVNRIFSSGFSNGGFMSHRLACEMSEVFSAVGPHAGVKAYGNTFTSCNTTFPVSVLHTHGSADGTIPYNGNILFGWPAVETNRDEYMLQFSTCSAPFNVQISPTTVCQRRDQCIRNGAITGVPVPLQWCRAEGLGHTWTVGQNGHPDLVATFMQFFTQSPVIPRPALPLPSKDLPGLDPSFEPIIEIYIDHEAQQAVSDTMLSAMAGHA